MPTTQKDQATPLLHHHLYLFSILCYTQIALGVSISWLIAYILTICDVFPDDPVVYGYQARTDLNSRAFDEAPVFRVPYPGRLFGYTLHFTLKYVRSFITIMILD